MTDERAQLGCLRRPARTATVGGGSGSKRERSGAETGGGRAEEGAPGAAPAEEDVSVISRTTRSPASSSPSPVKDMAGRPWCSLAQLWMGWLLPSRMIDLLVAQRPLPVMMIMGWFSVSAKAHLQSVKAHQDCLASWTPFFFVFLFVMRMPVWLYVLVYRKKEWWPVVFDLYTYVEKRRKCIRKGLNWMILLCCTALAATFTTFISLLLEIACHKIYYIVVNCYYWVSSMRACDALNNTVIIPCGRRWPSQWPPPVVVLLLRRQ
jgi:hypothetical protein